MNEFTAILITKDGFIRQVNLDEERQYYYLPISPDTARFYENKVVDLNMTIQTYKFELIAKRKKTLVYAERS